MQAWAWLCLHCHVQTPFDARCFFLCRNQQAGSVKTPIALYHSISLSITAGALWGIGYSGGRASNAQIWARAFSKPIWTPRWPGFPNQILQYNVRQLSFVKPLWSSWFFNIITVVKNVQPLLSIFSWWPLSTFSWLKLSTFPMMMMMMVIVIILSRWHEHLEHRCRMIKGFETWARTWHAVFAPPLHCICIICTLPPLHCNVFAPAHTHTRTMKSLVQG